MEIIKITHSNIDKEHICCALGNDKRNKAYAESKKTWMKEQFSNGLVFKRLDQRGKVFVEYMPIENAWKPVVGKDIMMIHCLWVSGKFKGEGWSSQLLNEVITDARSQGFKGLAVVTSQKKKPFLTDKKFFVKHGFHVCDTAPPYFELLVLPLEDDLEKPFFRTEVKETDIKMTTDFRFTFTNQCPFMESYVELLSNKVVEHGYTVEVKKLDSIEKVQSQGSPFGTFGFYFKGKFITHELMSEKGLNKWLSKLQEV